MVYSLMIASTCLPSFHKENLNDFETAQAIITWAFGLRLFFVLATEHTLLRTFLNIWCQSLFPGDLYDAAL